MAVETAGLVPLDAPLPQPRLYDLLAGAREVMMETDRWTAGASLWGYPPGPAYTFDPCGEGTYRLKESGGEVPNPMLGTITVYVPGVCTAKSIGPTADTYKGRLMLAFAALEGLAVERFLATGDGHAGLGPYLTDPNLEILNGGTAIEPVEGLALLEAEIATVGSGMIHVAPATATHWVANLLISVGRDGKMRTGLGTPVVIGGGYMAAYPDNAPGTPPDGQEWAFASGMVEYRRSEITVLPGNYSQALDRSVNEVVFIAERHYLVTWVGRQDTGDETQIQAGVLIDRQP
jgi:hypothetical protein